MVVLFKNKEYTISTTMAFAGIVALIAASPFIAGLVNGNGTSQGGQLPFTLTVRSFLPISYFIPSTSTGIFSIASFLLLPINYLLELGFFFLAGLLWLQEKKKGRWKQTQFNTAEIILLSVTFIICTFVRSTTIDSNDFGWRAWLPGQFILLVWSVDVIILFFPEIKFRQPATLSWVNRRVWSQLRIFIILGLLTTIVDIAMLRIWTMLVDTGVAGFPNSFSDNVELGRRTFAAREAYEFINHNTLQNIHIQQNTDELLNIPIGLYSNRAIAISGHTAFGIPKEDFLIHANSVGKIFNNESTWNEIDRSCKTNSIDMIVVNNEDPIWNYLPSLEEERHPFYQNQYYAVLNCGNTANQ
jgi:hypothetical protein